MCSVFCVSLCFSLALFHFLLFLSLALSLSLSFSFLVSFLSVFHFCFWFLLSFLFCLLSSFKLFFGFCCSACCLALFRIIIFHLCLLCIFCLPFVCVFVLLALVFWNLLIFGKPIKNIQKMEIEKTAKMKNAEQTDILTRAVSTIVFIHSVFFLFCVSLNFACFAENTIKIGFSTPKTTKKNNIYKLNIGPSIS